MEGARAAAEALSLLRAHVVPAISELEHASALAHAHRSLRAPCVAHARGSARWAVHATPFGTFVQSEKFSEGFMAQTWRALDVRDASLVMVKSFWLNDALTHRISSVIQRLMRLHTLLHPNILPILGAFVEQEQKRLFIFMKLMEKGSLLELRTRLGEFSEDVARPYVSQALVGLQFLHSNGFFHGAVKASNMLLKENGDIMLSDYCMADVISEAFGRSSAIGPIYWTAPEVIEGKVALAEKQDVWSVGCLVHELITYGPPHGKLPPLRALFLAVKNHIPKLNFISTELADFLSLCFKQNPTERPTLSDLLAHPWITPNNPHPAIPLDSPESLSEMLKIARSRFLPSLQCATIEDDPTWRSWSSMQFGAAIWFGGGNGLVTVYDTATRTIASRIEVHKTRIYSMLNVLNRRIWCSSEDGGIYIINPSKAAMKRLPVHDDEHKLIKKLVHTDPDDKHGRIWSLAPAPESSSIVVLSKRGEIKFQKSFKHFVNTIEADTTSQSVYLGCLGTVLILDATSYETKHVIEFNNELPNATTLKVSRILFTFGDLTWIGVGNHVFVFFGDNKKPDKDFTMRSEIINFSVVRDVLLVGDQHGSVECFSIRSCEHVHTLQNGPLLGQPGADYPVKCICPMPDSIWLGSYSSNVLHCWYLKQSQPTQ